MTNYAKILVNDKDFNIEYVENYTIFWDQSVNLIKAEE